MQIKVVLYLRIAFRWARLTQREANDRVKGAADERAASGRDHAALDDAIELAGGFVLIGTNWSGMKGEPSHESGLYCWVGGSRDTPPMRSWVIYIGIASGKGGMQRRTGNEVAWRGGDDARGLVLLRAGRGWSRESSPRPMPSIFAGWSSSLPTGGYLRRPSTLSRNGNE